MMTNKRIIQYAHIIGNGVIVMCLGMIIFYISQFEKSGNYRKSGLGISVLMTIIGISTLIGAGVIRRGVDCGYFKGIYYKLNGIAIVCIGAAFGLLRSFSNIRDAYYGNYDWVACARKTEVLIIVMFIPGLILMAIGLAAISFIYVIHLVIFKKIL